MTEVIERGMTDTEFARMNAGFDEHALEYGNPIQTSDRYGFVLADAGTFADCSSGLLYKNGMVCSGSFYLTDLSVEKPYRRRGFGATLLQKLEDRVTPLGVIHFLVATAGYEIVFEQENYYATGHSRVMLRKTRPAECK